MKIETAIITGTGFYSFPGAQVLSSETIETPYGEVEYEVINYESSDLVFLARHGKTHAIAPADINYRANMFALRKIGIKRILATSVSGSLYQEWPVGSLAILDQFINFTSGRKDTFFPLDGKVAHIDVSEPYCSSLHAQIMDSANSLGIKIKPYATYGCINGPRFETRAEIEMMKRMGCELVGHTNYPECVLARELQMCYASIGVVSNLAAGIGNSELTAQEVSYNVSRSLSDIASIFFTLLKAYPLSIDCKCHHATDAAFL